MGNSPAAKTHTSTENQGHEKGQVWLCSGRRAFLHTQGPYAWWAGSTLLRRKRKSIETSSNYPENSTSPRAESEKAALSYSRNQLADSRSPKCFKDLQNTPSFCLNCFLSSAFICQCSEQQWNYHSTETRGRQRHPRDNTDLLRRTKSQSWVWHIWSLRAFSYCTCFLFVYTLIYNSLGENQTKTKHFSLVKRAAEMNFVEQSFIITWGSLTLSFTVKCLDLLFIAQALQEGAVVFL